MTISERIFEIMKKKGMSQKEFSMLTNIGQSTISDWKHKKTTPSADKILPICQALGIGPEELLSGREHFSIRDRNQDYYVISRDSETGRLVEAYDDLDEERRLRLQGYLRALQEMKKGKETE